MTRARILWMLGGLAACAPAPEVVTDRLPMGRVGEVFSAAIVVEGGRGELTYAAEGLPGTITVNPAVGIVSGVPEFPGEYEVTVEVTDRAGRVATATYPWLVEESLRGCGRTLSGNFTEVGDFFDILWESEGSWATRSIAVPPDEIDRMRFALEGSISLRFVEPGQTVEPGVDVDEQAALPGGVSGWTGSLAFLDWTTYPSLGAYQAVSGPAELLLSSAFDAGEWQVDITCEAGPILTPEVIGPLRQGDFVRGWFRDIETNADTEIEVLDPLPAGVSIARSGLLEGRGEEAGTHAFRLRATRDDGSVTERAHGLAVYAPVEATCGSTVPFATAQGRDEADPAFGVDRDVAGFAVVETDWADHEGLSYEIAFDEGVGTVGVVDAATAVVGPVSAVREYSGEAVTVELTPQSWPVAAYSQAWPQARLVIYAPDRAVSGTVTVTCDDGPRPARYALPVLTPGQAGSFALPAVGGDPPYTWEAEGLPASVTLSSEGVLESDGTDFGAVTVDVTVSDAGGPGPTVPMPLWSSIRALCGPDAAILTCDGASSEVAGTFDDTVQTTVCIDPAALDASDWAYVQVTRVGDGFFPDVELLDYPDLTVRRGTFSRIGLVRGFNSYEFGLEHYAGLPFPFAVAEAFEDAGGSWRACLTCGTGPNPGFGAAGCPEL